MRRIIISANYGRVKLGLRVGFKLGLKLGSCLGPGCSTPASIMSTGRNPIHQREFAPASLSIPVLQVRPALARTLNP